MHDVKMLFWDEPYLCWSCADGIIHHCVHIGLDFECFECISLLACRWACADGIINHCVLGGSDFECFECISLLACGWAL